MQGEGRIKAIFISKSRNGILEFPEAVTVVAGKGIENDRYFEDANRKSRDCEITFIESETIEAYNACHAVKIDPWQPRRNILTQGIALNDLVGKRFSINGCVFEGVEICEPCELLRERTRKDAIKWFQGKGGLRASVLTGGRVELGNKLIMEKDHGR